MEYRNFSDDKFKLSARCKTKKNAENKAEAIRNKGKKARITFSAAGIPYFVWKEI